MEILNVQEISNYLKISTSTTRRLVSSKKIPFFRISGQIFFNKDLINQWILEQDTNKIIN